MEDNLSSINQCKKTALIAQLDKFPHIQRKLYLYWGYKEGRDFLSSLTISDRPNRRGFPFDVVIVINELTDLHDIEYPILKPRSKYVWD